MEFIFRSGDLSSRKGVKKEQSMLAGTRIHQKIQRRQSASYRPEVPFSIDIPVCLVDNEAPAYSIVIEGRADGIYEEDGRPAVDEIKGVYKPLEYINEPEPVHLAQAICYAYMDGIEDRLDRVIRLTYVNIDTEEEKYFRTYMSWIEIENWFDDLLVKYKKWCTFAWKHRQERNSSIYELKFPYDFRPGQKGLVSTAYRFLSEGKTLYIQASTGIGKTLSSVFPAFKAVGEGYAERIFYLTAKTITASVAREAMNILQERGLNASWINLTAKEKLCIQDEVNCDPEVCPYAKGHFDRINDAVYSLITEKSAITRDDILQCAEIFSVCPFELSLDITYWVDFIIGDYNYAMDPNVRLQRFFGDSVSCDGIFLIDEAHNLVDRAREMISATLRKEDFLAAKRLITPYSKRMKNAIESCNRELLALKRECDEFTPYDDFSIMEGIFDRLERLMEEFSRFYENEPNFYDKDFSSFYFMCRDFVNLRPSIENGYVAYGKLSQSEDYTLTLANVDPSQHIRECLERGKGSVLFSATLLPIYYYRSLLTGEQQENAIYAESPFDTSKRLLLIGTDVTSRYAARGREQYKKVLEYIAKIASAKSGHYITYFPSYSYMQNVFELAEGDLRSKIILQGQSMNEQEREDFLDAFATDSEETMIGFCVMGGIFSEGIDLRGKELIGVIIVGTGLPGVSPERNLVKDYFIKDGKDGFAYAYLYPGIGRVLQAAGRLIRTEEDEGVIALLDDRFSRNEYRMLFPREWNDAKYTNINILDKELDDFWNSRC